MYIELKHKLDRQTDTMVEIKIERKSVKRDL